MPLNVELLLKIKAHILEEPKRLAMQDWLVTGLKPGSEYHGDIEDTVPDCGTVGCIAGWAVMLVDNTNHENLTSRAIQLLGITKHPLYEQLFYTDQWRQEIKIEYMLAVEDEDHPAIAVATAKQIDWFIANYADMEAKNA